MPDTGSDERTSPGTIDCASAMDDAGVGSVFPIREPMYDCRPRLESYLTNVVHTTSSERKLLLDGSPITKFLNVDPIREVSVFGAIWINASPRRYVEAVNDVEHSRAVRRS
jgi:hypothetical protein